VTTPVRIANCSGFYGDRISALSEQLRDGPIDVITGDYLAASCRTRSARCWSAASRWW
jgi:hypothetical protein